ncbi:MAG TPA: enoyl-ACP reductase FabV [Candidatus Omnitrophota bacterium]|nr:enoyl-ACP reductase FabV [Candidatus Omnitrophota bacterium]
MIIQPKIRGFICTTAHPQGCAAHVQEQIDYVRKKGSVSNGPKKALIIGASTGYGLASRIVTAFACRAATLGVVFEREAEGKRTASAGWYNTAAFEEKAHQEGLYAKTVNGDAFSDEVKQKIIDLIKKDLGQVDLIIYSLASPRRQHPKTGQVAKSVLRPIGKKFTNKNLNMETHKLETVTLPVATPEEIEQTVSVMGGEDWEMWMDAFSKENLLAKGVTSVAYSYMGADVTKDVYRNGTIGKAKEHLEATASKIDQKLKARGGRAYVSVNKALVTQSSSAIPFIPLYYVILNKVMKEKKLDEDCVAQIYRLFATALYIKEKTPVDSHGLIRLDDEELREDVQKEVMKNWQNLNEGNLNKVADIKGYDKAFLKLFGFGLSNVDYNADVDPYKKIPSLP